MEKGPGPRSEAVLHGASAVADFVESLREMDVTPHVAQDDTNRSSAIDARTTRHSDHQISQRKPREEAAQDVVDADEGPTDRARSPVPCALASVHFTCQTQGHDLQQPPFFRSLLEAFCHG